MTKWPAWLPLNNIHWTITVVIGLLFIAACRSTSAPTEVVTLVDTLQLAVSGNQIQLGEEVSLWVEGTTSKSASYIWRIDGEVQSGQNEYIISFTPAALKSYVISVEVRDNDINKVLNTIITVIEQPSATPTTLTPSPTGTPSPTLTYTPPPSATLTPTHTSTPTAISTLTPTSTSTPTATPTSIPIPPSPTSMPADAVVTAPNGIELLCGPGTKSDGSNKYELITTLPQGTTLEVIRRAFDNDDWLKVSVDRDSVENLESKIALTSCPGRRVSVFSESGKGIEGWVITATGSIEVNDLSDASLVYEFGPGLLEPKQFETRSLEEIITFKWRDYGPLAENQIYSVILVRDDLTDAGACFHWQTREPQMSFKPKDYNCTRGDYHWGVGIATDLSGGIGDTRIWQDDSEFDERNPIGIGVPHSKKPENGGESGSGGGGGTIISDEK